MQGTENRVLYLKSMDLKTEKTMKAVTKIIFLDENGEKFFGEGPCRLLHAVAETGSLRAAALSMGMAYTKALKILKNAEQALGFALT